jgi:hypothetical protein
MLWPLYPRARTPVPIEYEIRWTQSRSSLPSARIRNPGILSRSLVAMLTELWELWNKITSCILHVRISRLRKIPLKYEIPYTCKGLNSEKVKLIL